MSLRLKLIGAMMLVALTVPLLGGVAIERLFAIDDAVTTRGAEHPALVLVNGLERSQQEQESAVLAYLSSGDPADAQRLEELSEAFDARLAELSEIIAAGDAGPSPDLLARIVEERTAFRDTAGQLIRSRAAMAEGISDLRGDASEIERDLTSLRMRYVPSASNVPVDPTSLPDSVRSQIDDLLVGTEGMLHIVGLQLALATGYTIAPDGSATQQFNSATPIFKSWLDVANAAGGSEDRAILSRVLNRYVDEFEPAGRSTMKAADDTASMRNEFKGLSNGIVTLLEESAQQQAARMTAAEQRATSIAHGATRLLIVLTLAAFVLAGTLGALLGNRIVGPLIRLRNVADRASRGDAENVEVPIEGNDEVGELAGAVRRLLVSIKVLMAGEQETSERDQPIVR